jgi:RNA polymerase sigma factor (sigma-70 family)
LAFLRKISSPETSDAELAAQYWQSNDLSVLGELYNRYMDLVYGVCLKYLKEPEDAQDSVMSIFEELVTKLQKHEVDNFKSWLYTLAKNHCLMRLRSEKKKGTVKIADDLMQSEENLHLQDVLEKEANFKHLEYCMAQLANEQRQVIELFYLQGKCYNEIAAQTGMDWNHVRSFIQNGRRNLKICMENQAVKLTVK